jgi:hypothetical protein
MSHITTIKDILIKDLNVLQRAVERLADTRVEVHDPKPIKLYQKEPVLSVAQVKFVSWTYPVLVAPSGEIHYDNYSGKWGKISHLNKLKQMYGLEKSKQLAKAQGYLCREKQKQGGAIVLELTR